MNYNENKEEPITTPDTKNRTKINSAEGTDPVLDKNGENKWDRMSRINTGVSDSFGNRDETSVRMQERACAFDVISDHLFLPEVYQREGREIMQNIDLEKVTYTGSTIHMVAFCVAIHMVNRDDLPRSYHPQRSPENNDQHFNDTAEEFGFRNRTINSILQKVEKQL